MPQRKFKKGDIIRVVPSSCAWMNEIIQEGALVITEIRADGIIANVKRLDGEKFQCKLSPFVLTECIELDPFLTATRKAAQTRDPLPKAENGASRRTKKKRGEQCNK